MASELKNFNLHIMTSAYFLKIDCISVNIDRFSFKFWYVLAETIFYKFLYSQFFIFDKGIMAYFCDSRRHVNFSHFACILYGTWLFLKTGFYTPVFREQNLRCFSFVFAELWICCSWDNKLPQMCLLFFDQMPGLCLYFTCKVGFENPIFRLRVIAKGDCFGISLTHLTSILEVPGSSPGVSNYCFALLFFLFDLSLYHLLWLLKHVESANNVINNPICFIITLFSLHPLLFAYNPYGRWLFLKSGVYIPVFCEQYRRYFCLDFVDFWVCCSWDYMLSKSTLIFSIRCHDRAHDHDHDHHDHHYRNDDNHLSITFSFLWIR